MELNLDKKVVTGTSSAGGASVTRFAALIGADAEQTTQIVKDAASATAAAIASATAAVTPEAEVRQTTEGASIVGFITGAAKTASENNMDVASLTNAAASGSSQGAVLAAAASGSNPRRRPPKPRPLELLKAPLKLLRQLEWIRCHGASSCGRLREQVPQGDSSRPFRGSNRGRLCGLFIWFATRRSSRGGQHWYQSELCY